MKIKTSKTNIADKTNITDKAAISAREHLRGEVGVNDVYFAGLEPRIALDAAAGAELIDEALDTVDVELEAVELTAPVAPSASAADLVQMLEADAEAGSASDLSRQILFVDASIENFDEFMAEIPSDIEAHVISTDRDGVSQIASILAGRSDIEAVHIVSHGDVGALILGDSLVTPESIQGRHADDLTAIGASLTDSADIMIYGCDFAFGADGEVATNLLAMATGADVAASTDVTGSEIFGGDWVLEYETGEIEADALQLDEWEGKLNNTVVGVPIDGSYGFSAADFDSGRGGTTSSITIVALPRDGELTLGGVAVVEGQEIAAADLASLLYTPPAGGDVNVDYRLYYTADDDIGPNPSPPMGIFLDTYVDYMVEDRDYFVDVSHSPTDWNPAAFHISAVPDGRPVMFDQHGQEWNAGDDFNHVHPTTGRIFIRHYSGTAGDPIDGLIVEAPRTIKSVSFTSDFSFRSNTKFVDNKGFHPTLFPDGGRLWVADDSRLLTSGLYAEADDVLITRSINVPVDAAYFETLITGFMEQSRNIHVQIYGDAADGTRTLLHDQMIADDAMVEVKLDVSGYESLDLTYTTTDGQNDAYFGLEKPVFTLASNQIVTSADQAAAIDLQLVQEPPAGETWDSFSLAFAPENGAVQLGGIDLVVGTSYQMSDLDNVLFVATAGTAVGRDVGMFSLELTASDGATAREVVSVSIVNNPTVAPSSADVSAVIDEGSSYSFSAADFAFVGFDGNSVEQLVVDVLPGAGTLTLNGVAVTVGQEIAVSQVDDLLFTADFGTHGAPYNSFDFRVRDSADTLSETYTVSIDVAHLDVAPTTSDHSVTTPEDTNYAFSESEFAFVDQNPDDSLAAVIIDSLPSFGTLSLNGVAVTAGQEIATADIANLIYSPSENVNGVDSFTFSVKDSSGLVSDAPSTITIDVASVPDAPEGADNRLSTNEDAVYTFRIAQFGFSDGDADRFTAVIIHSLPASGTLFYGNDPVTVDQTINANRLTSLIYIPSADAVGTGLASFTFSVKDRSGLVSDAPSTITIDVTSLEDAPEGADHTVATVEDTDYDFSQADFGFTDADADSTFAAVIIERLPAAGALSLNGVVVTAGQEIAVADIPDLVYSPPADRSGMDLGLFTFSVKDNTGRVSDDRSTMRVHVTSLEDAPGGADNTEAAVVEVSIDGSYSFSAADFDSGRGGTTSSITIAALPRDGELTLNGVAVVEGQEIAAADLRNLLYTPSAGADINVDYRLYYTVDDDIGPNPSPPMGIYIDTYVDYTVPNSDYFATTGHLPADLPVRAFNILAVPDGEPLIYTDAGNRRAVDSSFTQAQVDAGQVVVRHYSGTAGEPIDGLVVEVERDVNVNHFTSTSSIKFFDDAGYPPNIAVNGQLLVYDRSHTLSDGIYARVDADLVTRTLNVPADAAYFETLITGFVGQGGNIQVQIYGDAADGTRTLLHDQFIADDPMVDIKLDVSGYESLDLVYTTTDGLNNRHFGLEKPVFTTATSQIVTSADQAAAIDMRLVQEPPADAIWDSFSLAFAPENGALQLGGIDLVAGTSYQMSDLDDILFVPTADIAVGRDVELFSLELTASDGATAREVVSVSIVNNPTVAPSSADVSAVIDEGSSYSFSAADFAFVGFDGNSVEQLVVDVLPGAGALTLNGVAVMAGQEIAVSQVDDLLFTADFGTHGAPYNSFDFRVRDSANTLSETYTVAIDVVHVPVAPTTSDHSVTTPEDTNYAFSESEFAFVDQNPDDSLAAVIIDSLPSFGTLSLNGVAVTAGREIATADIANLIYSPSENVNGVDSFGFSVKDSTGLVSDAPSTITIDVTPVEDAPDTSNKPVFTAEDTDYIFSPDDFSFRDPDADSTFAAVIIETLPAAGGLSLNGEAVTAGQEIAFADIPNLVYSPPANRSGMDLGLFTFSVKDNTGRVSDDPRSIRMHVTSVEDAPEGADNTVATAEEVDHTFSVAEFGFSDADADSTFAAVIIDSLPVSGTLVLDGVAVSASQEIAVADLVNLAYLSSENANGTMSFGFSVKDSTGLVSEASRTMTIDVTPVEDAPEAADNTVSTAEGTDMSFTEGDFGFSDVDADSTFAAVIIDSLPAAGTLALNGAPVSASQEIALADIASLVYSPPANAFGTGLASFTFSVKDSTGLVSEASRTITIDVTAVDNAPEGTDNTVSITEDTDLSFSQSDFGFSDADADSTFAAVIIDSVPTSGVLSLNGAPVSASQEIATTDIANLVYSPPANELGDGLGSFTFSVKDSTGLVSEASRTMTIDVTSVQDAPEGADNTVSTVEDVHHTFNLAEFGFSDVDADSTFAAVIIDGLPTSGTLALDGVAVSASQEIAVADLVKLTYLSSENANGTMNFGFSVKDSTGLVSEASRTMTIDVTPVEDAPEGADNIVSTAEDTDMSFTEGDFGFRDVDADSTFAAVIIDSLPTSGVLSLNGVPVSASQEIAVADIANLIYSPPANSFGAGLANFTFSVKDSTGLVSNAPSTITIDVTSVQDAPEGADNNVATAEDTVYSFSLADFQYSDIDGDALISVIIDRLPSVGTLSVNGMPVSAGQAIVLADVDGLSFISEDPTSSEPVSFSYRLRDDGGTSDGGVDTSVIYSMNITVEPVYELTASFAANRASEINFATDLHLVDGDSVTREADPANEHIEFSYVDGAGPRILFEAGDTIPANQADGWVISSSDSTMDGEFTVSFVIDRADGSRGHVDLTLEIKPAAYEELVNENSRSRVRIEHPVDYTEKVAALGERQSLSLLGAAQSFGSRQGLGELGFSSENDELFSAEPFETGSILSRQIIDRAESNVHNMRVDLTADEDNLVVVIDDLLVEFGENRRIENGLIIEMLDGSALPNWITVTATGEIEIDRNQSRGVNLVELRVIRVGDADTDGTVVRVDLAESSVQIAAVSAAEQ